MLGEEDVAAYLRGKTVAVVGNASSALEQENGEQIDAADVVVRLNAGVPGPEHYAALGRRTDVLQTGNLRCMRASSRAIVVPPTMFWFAKPTRFGDAEWASIADGLTTRTGPWWRVPNASIAALRAEMGSPPSGGAIAVSVALKHAAEVHVYGFSHFEGGSWWHRDRPRAMISRKGVPGAHDHDGAKERAWFEAQGLI